jgi:hypothetical protein
MKGRNEKMDDIVVHYRPDSFPKQHHAAPLTAVAGTARCLACELVPEEDCRRETLFGAAP